MIATATPCQQRVMDAIDELTRQLGYPPTMREIAAAVGTNQSDVFQKCDRLRRAGLVDWRPGFCRTIRVVR